MNFDDRFLGILNMLGSVNKNNSTPQNDSQKQNQGMGLDGIMNIMGLMQGFQGLSNGANQQAGNSNGLDIMKILPLITALKGGGFPMGNMQNANQQNYGNDNDSVSNIQSENTKNQGTENATKQCGFKDKYYAISFAGNEVIYALGKLWKTYKT